MGFWFGCFRFRTIEQQKNRHSICTSIADKKNVDRDELGRKKQLGSFFLEEGECDRASVKVENLVSHRGICKEISYQELKHEAKFLKSCGALLQTPAEIKKASVFETIKRSEVSSECQDQLSDDPPSKKLFCDDEIEQLPMSPSSVQEGSQLLNDNTESCTSKDNETRVLHESSLLPISLPEEVNFDGVKEELNDNLADATKTVTSPCHTKFEVETAASRQSPTPTPWKVTDEMQTPATVYPANMMSEHSTGRQNNEVIDDKECLPQNTLSSLATPTASSVKKVDQELAIGSLSDWLKPTPSRKVLVDGLNMGKNSHSGKSSDADRPIIGMVAAHWSDEKKLEQSPKIWDGNGIPNSTNKYKEDQRVSWHATPFEERLEKALSDESFLP